MSSVSQTSSSATPTPTGFIPRYGIFTKRGTSEETFEKFIQELDGGSSYKVTWPGLKTQTYLVPLNDSQVAELPTLYSFIDRIILHDVPRDVIEGQIEEFRAITRDVGGASAAQHSRNVPNGGTIFQTLSSYAVSRKELVSRADSLWWKKMLAAPPPAAGQPIPNPDNYFPYLADDSGGKGTTIYVLDDGFDEIPVSSVLLSLTSAEDTGSGGGDPESGKKVHSGCVHNYRSIPRQEDTTRGSWKWAPWNNVTMPVQEFHRE